jgi:hypothetical protein
MGLLMAAYNKHQSGRDENVACCVATSMEAIDSIEGAEKRHRAVLVIVLGLLLLRQA